MNPLLQISSSREAFRFLKNFLCCQLRLGRGMLEVLLSSLAQEFQQLVQLNNTMVLPSSRDKQRVLTQFRITSKSKDEDICVRGVNL